MATDEATTTALEIKKLRNVLFEREYTCFRIDDNAIESARIVVWTVPRAAARRSNSRLDTFELSESSVAISPQVVPSQAAGRPRQGEIRRAVLQLHADIVPLHWIEGYKVEDSIWTERNGEVWEAVERYLAAVAAQATAKKEATAKKK